MCSNLKHRISSQNNPQPSVGFWESQKVFGSLYFLVLLSVDNSLVSNISSAFPTQHILPPGLTACVLLNILYLKMKTFVSQPSWLPPSYTFRWSTDTDRKSFSPVTETFWDSRLQNCNFFISLLDRVRKVRPRKHLVQRTEHRYLKVLVVLDLSGWRQDTAAPRYTPGTQTHTPVKITALLQTVFYWFYILYNVFILSIIITIIIILFCIKNYKNSLKNTDMELLISVLL